MDKIKIHLKNLEKWLANLENYKKELNIIYGFPKYKDFLDLLNKLEKNGILDIYEWKKLRVIRNNFSYEYPEDIEEITANINEAIENIDILKINNIKKCVK